jgi:hypothetical protein
MGSSTSARHRREAAGRDRGETLPLLMFEAAGCLMAVPAYEVTRLVALESATQGDATAAAAHEGIDLNQHFVTRQAEGPWLQWTRGARQRWLRVDRVLDVLACPLGSLSPLPMLERFGPARVFWAAGVRAGEIFLVLDPARLEHQPDGQGPGPA